MKIFIALALLGQFFNNASAQTNIFSNQQEICDVKINLSHVKLLNSLDNDDISELLITSVKTDYESYVSDDNHMYKLVDAMTKTFTTYGLGKITKRGCQYANDCQIDIPVNKVNEYVELPHLFEIQTNRLASELKLSIVALDYDTYLPALLDEAVAGTKITLNKESLVRRMTNKVKTKVGNRDIISGDRLFTVGKGSSDSFIGKLIFKSHVEISCLEI